MESLINKIALVSGSSQGIGKETAKLFAQRGASVILLARNKAKLEGVLSELSVVNEHQNIVFWLLISRIL
jgi:short-subunit dehydrogenase